MLEAINEFVSNNSMMVLLGLVAVVVLIGFVMFRRSNNAGPSHMEMAPIPTPSHDLEGLDNTNMVCDLANGVCMPVHEQHQMEVDHPMPHAEDGHLPEQH
jgi:LPXTG-motif cell wall-anchored protein